MLYGSIRRNLYAHLSIHKMRWTLVFDYLFTPISTPKWHESIWFCMKFYEFTISKNFVTMRFYGLLLIYIDLWKKANLQRFLISFSLFPPKIPLIFKGFQHTYFCMSQDMHRKSWNFCFITDFKQRCIICTVLDRCSFSTQKHKFFPFCWNFWNPLILFVFLV